MNTYSKIIRASAIYDILATSLFAFPGVARVLFFIAMFYAWVNGATDLLVFFMVSELAWGVVQIVGYIKQTATWRRLHVHW